jgi:hypothetical protein
MRRWPNYIAQQAIKVRRGPGQLRKKRPFHPSGDCSEFITAIELKLDEVTQMRKKVKALRVYVRSCGCGIKLQSLTALLLALRLTKQSLEAARSCFKILVSSRVARFFLPSLLTISLVRVEQYDHDRTTTEGLVETTRG